MERLLIARRIVQAVQQQTAVLLHGDDHIGLQRLTVVGRRKLDPKSKEVVLLVEQLCRLNVVKVGRGSFVGAQTEDLILFLADERFAVDGSLLQLLDALGGEDGLDDLIVVGNDLVAVDVGSGAGEQLGVAWLIDRLRLLQQLDDAVAGWNGSREEQLIAEDTQHQQNGSGEKDFGFRVAFFFRSCKQLLWVE